MRNYFVAFILAVVFYSCTHSSSENKTQGDTTATVLQDTSGGDQTSIVLPAPYATKSVANSSVVIGWGDKAKPQAPEGFTVTRYASNLLNPRWMYVLPNGDVLVAETKKVEKPVEKVKNKIMGMDKSHGDSPVGNRITIFRDSNKDGSPDLQKVFLTGLSMPFGMTLVRNYFYVANSDAVWRYPYKTGETSITAKGEKILDLPSEGRHWTRNLIANADGSKIYVAVGSSSNVAEDGIDKEEKRADILEINPDGSGLRVYASGLRNPVGMDWMPGTSTLWTAVNERDELGDDLVPDYLTSVKENGFYGWPYSYFGQHLDPRIKPEEQRPDLVKSAIVPDVPLGSHTASLGLAFYNQETFPEKYRNGAFIGQHGSWNRSVFAGYRVVFIPFKNGKAGASEDFLTGFIADESKKAVCGRPVGVTVAQDGALLVADDAGNTIWRVSYDKR